MPLFVVGLGSELAGDDAVGLTLVAHLRDRRVDASCLMWPDADALTVAHDLLALPGAVLLVDCADMRLAPGSTRLLATDEVRLRVKHSPVSVHGLGIAEALELARRLGFDRPVHYFGVQPHELAPGTGLSAALAARVPRLVDELEAAVLALTGAEAAGRRHGGRRA